MEKDPPSYGESGSFGENVAPQNGAPDSWISDALKNPFRKAASEEVKKIFEMFSRRNKSSVGIGECSKISPVGGLRENNKVIQFHPDHTQYLCEDADFEGHFKRGCIIYSFGLDESWDFENTTASKGCKVWVYDAFVTEKPKNLSPNLQFFRHGLGSRNEKRIIKNEEVQFSTLEELLTLNKHKKSFLSYVKINLKGEEWQILDEITSESPLVANNILQLGLTTHLHSALLDYRLYGMYMKILNRFTELGFQLFLSKEIQARNETYSEPLIGDKVVALTNYLAFLRL